MIVLAVTKFTIKPLIETEDGCIANAPGSSCPLQQKRLVAAPL